MNTDVRKEESVVDSWDQRESADRWSLANVSICEQTYTGTVAVPSSIRFLTHPNPIKGTVHCEYSKI